MELATQFISNDKIVRSNIVQFLKHFNLQSLKTEARKREHLISMMPGIEKTFDFLCDDTLEFSTENESLI